VLCWDFLYIAVSRRVLNLCQLVFRRGGRLTTPILRIPEFPSLSGNLGNFSTTIPVLWILAADVSFYDNALPFLTWGHDMLSRRFRLLFAFAVLVLCQARSWADMPPISDEDKKLSTVPGQPGAPAGYLFREEIYDDLRHSAKIEARIKIFTEEGRKYADITIPYDRKDFDIVAISGRTIHPDGTVIPFQGKPFQKTMFRGKDIRYQVKAFTLPDVQPGSIIEYKYTLIYPDNMLYAPRWVIQDTLWQKQAHFRFYMWPKEVQLDHDQIARGVAYTVRVAKGMEPKQVDLPNGDSYIELTANDVPPFIDEPYMPDSDQFKMNVRFYYRNSADSKKFWETQTKFWDKDVEKFINKKNGVADAVAKIVGPNDTPEQKARKIYTFIIGLDNENYLPQRTIQELKTTRAVRGVEDVLAQKRGDSEDITRTFVALARAAGLQAYVMRVTSRENNFFDSSFLDFHQLDDEIAIVQLDGKDVYLDPGAKFSRFGQLDWRHTICGGYRQTTTKPTFAQTPEPSYKDAVIERLANFTVKPDLMMEGHMKVVYSGFFATNKRRSASRTDDEGRKKLLEDEVKEWLPVDAEVKLANTPNWNDVQADLTAEFQVSAAVASNAGKRILFPAQTFHFNEKPMFPHAERTNGIYLYYPSREIDQITFSVPPNLSVESLPKTDTVRLQYAMYTNQYTGTGNTITTVRDIAMNGIIFGKESYGEVKGFYDKVKADDEQQIIFRSAGNVAAGN
jgi:transglutaminase-like putative cysteine protease